MNILIPVNKRKFPMLLVGSFLLTLIVAWILRTLIARNMVYYGNLNWLFLGGPLYYLVISLAEYTKTLFDKNAYLRISDEGVEDRSSIFSCGKIPWAEVEGVYLQKIMKKSFLIIRVKDPARLIARQAYWKRHVLRRMTVRWHTPVMISQRRFAYDLNQLYSALEPLAGRGPNSSS